MSSDVIPVLHPLLPPNYARRHVCSSIFNKHECFLIVQYKLNNPGKTYKQIAIWAKKEFLIRKKVYPIQIQNIILQAHKNICLKINEIDPIYIPSE